MAEDALLSPPQPQALLRIENLRVEFGRFPAVDGLDLSLAPGELLGIVGESGLGQIGGHAGLDGPG